MSTWLEFDSLVNARDVGGIPTRDGGRIAERRLLRSDNLQDLTRADVQRLRDLGVTDIIDLRSLYEVESTGPGPLVGQEGFTFHHFSYFIEQHADDSDEAGDAELPGDTLPWAGRRDTSITVPDGFASTYLSFLVDRPASVLGALRGIAASPGAALVHCAAGKDRTGTTAALALLVAGAERQAVIDDYAASSERMDRIVGRLLGTRTYGANLAHRPMSSHLTQPVTMEAFLDYADDTHGGVEPMLAATIGWTEDDTARMRRSLRER